MISLFTPGCALLLYKPHLAERLARHLEAHYGSRGNLLTCCRHTPQVPEGTRVINVCPGCDRRYRENYARPNTISLWEFLADDRDFAFPDYAGQEMTIIDARPTRNEDRIHEAVRTLADRMRITLVEPTATRRTGTCCGDTFYGKIPTGKVIERMRKKADRMPREDVLIYCVSCSKSMFNGGKRPRYLVDLLFGEDTLPGTRHPDAWHDELDLFIEGHAAFQVETGPLGSESDRGS